MVQVASAALAEARAAGLEVRVEADRLVVRGPRSREGLAQQLLERKGEVLALLAAEDAEVAWRVAALRPQVPKRGPIAVLTVRDVPPEWGRCVSCGGRLGDGRTARCEPCARAAWLDLHQAREGVDA